MRVDVSEVEALNYLFLRVIGQVFLSPATEKNPLVNEMTGAQKRLLYLLDLHGPQKMTEIARRIGVSVPAATNVADKLVRSGLAVRQAHETDRRITIIELTESGQETIKQLKSLHEKRLAQVLDALEPEKRGELISCFDRIHTLLSEIEVQEAAR